MNIEYVECLKRGKDIYTRDDIVEIQPKYKSGIETKTIRGRIVDIDSTLITLDCSSDYQAYEEQVDLKDIERIEKVGEAGGCSCIYCGIPKREAVPVSLHDGMFICFVCARYIKKRYEEDANVYK